MSGTVIVNLILFSGSFGWWVLCKCSEKRMDLVLKLERSRAQDERSQWETAMVRRMVAMRKGLCGSEDCTVVKEFPTYDQHKLRGHPIRKDSEGDWVFQDNGEPTISTWRKRPCGHCGKHGTQDDDFADPCLGKLPGVVNACCGHGSSADAYICFENGSVVRGFKVVETMDDRDAENTQDR